VSRSRPASAEREAKLVVGPTFRMPELAGLCDGVEALEPRTLTFTTVYFDTDDLRLTRWGCVLRHRDAEGWTVKLPGVSQGPLLVRGEHVFAGTRAAPPAGALDLLRAYIRTASLSPVARLRSVRTAVPLQATGGLMAGEIVDDEVSVLDGTHVAARFREVEVELTDSAPEPMLEAALARLRLAGASGSSTPKIVRALGPPAELPSELVCGRPPARTVGDLVATALSAPTFDLVSGDPGVRLGGDTEAVHIMRVATRHLRSGLRTFRSVLEPSWAARLRDELGWLAAELGPVRDVDVMISVLAVEIQRLPRTDRSAAAGLLGRLEHQRDGSRVKLLQAMASDRYVALLDDLVRACREPAILPQAAGLSAVSLGSLMEAPWERLQESCRDLGPRPKDRQLHSVRILSKRARYTAEALTPAFGRRAESFANAAAGLQGVLGAHHDAVITAEWLRRQVPDLESAPAFVAGILAERERRLAQSLRPAWQARWTQLDRPRLRFWR
jgi:CHAD domain-containing protein